MKILYQELAKKSGGQASYWMLLRTLANEYPDDQFIIITSKDSFYWQLEALHNVQMIPFHDGVLKEFQRFWLETFSIRRIAKQCGAHVIWTTNIGPYVRTGVPQALMVLNPYQVCPWSLARTHPRSRLIAAVLRWFFRRSLRCCDAVQVEMAILGEAVRRIPGAPPRIEVIPKAVESSDDFEPQPLSAEMQKWFDGGLGHSAFTFLFVATYSPHKNHAAVVAAMEQLRSRGVMARLALSVTQEQLSRSCNPELVASLIESGRILPLGWLDKVHLRAVYDACDACVMPSKSEQLSSAHLEAMHWKKPQISADLPYAHDLCGDATLYADPDDPNEWADKMQSLMRDSELQERLVAAGLDCMKTFPQSWKEVAHRVRAFLAEVAGERQTS